jgi:hypothetical protein
VEICEYMPVTGEASRRGEHRDGHLLEIVENRPQRCSDISCSEYRDATTKRDDVACMCEVTEGSWTVPDRRTSSFTCMF